MNLHDVMTDLAAACDTIEGLRPFPYWAPNPISPAAVIGWPDPYDYDETMGRGTDTATFPVIVLVAMSDPRTASERLAAYCDGSGASSVKVAIEAYEAESYHEAVVRSVEFSVMSVAGVDHLAAEFSIYISANGA